MPKSLSRSQLEGSLDRVGVRGLSPEQLMRAIPGPLLKRIRGLPQQGSSTEAAIARDINIGEDEVMASQQGSPARRAVNGFIVGYIGLRYVVQSLDGGDFCAS